MRILFTGGGTGGHFFPLVAVIRELKAIAEKQYILNLELYYMGPARLAGASAKRDGFGEELLGQEQVVVIPVLAGKLRRYFSLQNILDVGRLGIGICQALWNFFLIMPDVVFSKGGYGALPAVIAAVVFRIPLIIHESDAVPGRVSQFSARFAKRIGVGFGGSFQYFPKEKTAMVGIPIRKRILGGSRDEAKENLNIFSRLHVIGIIGASQGSQKLNEAVLGILKELTDEYELAHQTGEKNFEAVSEEAKVILEFAHKERYHPFGLLDESKLRDFYQACDLIVSRASSSIFEIAAWGKPSVLVPLENAAQDHQRKNAYEYAGAGAAVVIEEGNLTPHVLLGEIKKLIGNPDKMKRMGEAAQQFARVDAGEVIAQEILKLGVH